MESPGALVLFALIQGLTEALPVSSSLHFLLIAHFLGIENPDKVLNVFLHLGTLGAFVWYFRRDVGACWTAVIQGLRGQFRSPSFGLMGCLVVATLPTVLVGLGLHKYPLPSSCASVLAMSSAFFGLVLYGMDRWAPVSSHRKQPSYGRTFFLGCLQAIAFFPGVSRLGICITGGRLVGLSRENATRWAFLMGIPALSGAVVLNAKAIGIAMVQSSSLGLGMLGMGLGFSFCISLGLIHGFMELVKRQGFGWIAVYRVLLGIVLWIYLP